MKKITFLILLIFLVAVNGNAQKLMRSTLGVTGSSTLITSNSKTYVVQQSVGQSSVIGKFKSNGFVLRQGFLQPTVISSEVIPEKTNLQAVIYPNPVSDIVNISFNEPITEQVSINIFDMLGRSVFSKELNAAQNLSIDLNRLAIAQYIFLMNTGQKQFKAKLIKK